MLAQSILFAITTALAVSAAPAPVPSGGVGVRPNDTAPIYGAMTDFDYQSFLLGVNQEWIELDLFHYGVARFSAEEFADAGMNAEDVSLLEFMANQELGHATLLNNILSNGGHATALQCTYKYDFNTVREYVDFCQQLTRWGESGVYGFLSHLDNRPSANLLTQSIATEARQQMIFRQFSGAQPMPVYFETGISQAMAWSLLSRYIVECPAQNAKIAWPIYPSLTVDNGVPLTVDGYNAAITHNRTTLTQPGCVLSLSWEEPGQTVSYNNSYTTEVGGNVNSTTPQFLAFISQLNVTYVPLTMTGNNSGTAVQPNATVFGDTPTDQQINGTMFIAAVTEDVYVTPYNLSLLNDYIVAFGLYQAN